VLGGVEAETKITFTGTARFFSGMTVLNCKSFQRGNLWSSF